jgi:hypothetical protein
MTIEQALERARAEMNVIFAVKLRETTNAMLLHGARRDEVAAFTFNDWREDELDKLREELLRDQDTLH